MYLSLSDTANAFCSARITARWDARIEPKPVAPASSVRGTQKMSWTFSLSESANAFFHARRTARMDTGVKLKPVAPASSVRDTQTVCCGASFTFSQRKRVFLCTNDSALGRSNRAKPSSARVQHPRHPDSVLWCTIHFQSAQTRFVLHE